MWIHVPRDLGEIGGGGGAGLRRAKKCPVLWRMPVRQGKNPVEVKVLSIQQLFSFLFVCFSSFSFSIFKLFFLLFCFRQLFSKYAFSTCSSGFIFWKLIRYVNFGVPPVSAGWSPEICATYLFIYGLDSVPM